MKDDGDIKGFIEKCTDVDFSVQSVNKEKNLSTLMQRLNHIQNEEEMDMKRTRRPMTMMLVAAALLVAATATVFAKDISYAIRNYFVGDNSQIFVVESEYEIEIPEEFIGQVFDAEGNVLTHNRPRDLWYNAEGDLITFGLDADGKMVLRKSSDVYISVRDFDEALGYFKHTSALPGYVPDGYEFAVAFFTDLNGTLHETGSDRLTLAYKSMETGHSIIVNISYTGDGGVGYYSSQGDGSEPREMEINGRNVTVIGQSIYVQIDEFLYNLGYSDDAMFDEVVKMVESI